MAVAIMLRQEGEYESMKGRDLERLKNDFDKYCEQIGIVDKLMLVVDRKEMHTILVNAGKPKRCAGWGECFWELKTIFVDAGIRIPLI
jgi:hypothetical protein